MAIRAWLRREPFEAFELIGMAAALVGAALLCRHAFAHWSIASPEARVAIAFGSAALGLAPFVLRRRRRQLRRQRSA